MHPRDLEQLRRWIVSRASIGEVLDAGPVGLLENVRFTESARRAYILLWTWSAPRFHGRYGENHDRAYKRLGPALYHKRIERANAHLKRLGEQE